MLSHPLTAKKQKKVLKLKNTLKVKQIKKGKTHKAPYGFFCSSAVFRRMKKFSTSLDSAVSWYYCVRLSWKSLIPHFPRQQKLIQIYLPFVSFRLSLCLFLTSAFPSCGERKPKETRWIYDCSVSPYLFKFEIYAFLTLVFFFFSFSNFFARLNRNLKNFLKFNSKINFYLVKFDSR